MADNIAVTEGSGKSVRSEDIAGQQYHLIKLVDATAASVARTGVAANPFQVSLANTGANATAVKTDGSAVTQPVSGTFFQATQPVSAVNLDIRDLAFATDKVDVSGSTIDVNIVAEGNVAEEVGGNLERLVAGTHLEDDASANAHRGYGILAVRQDTPANTGADGDYEFLKMSAGRLWVSAINNGTFVVQENGTQVQVDDAAFTPATSKIVMQGFLADESATDSVNEGDGGAARITLDRKQIVSTYAHGAGGFTPVAGSIGATKTDLGTANTPGTVGGWYFYNSNATVAYVQFFNAQASAVTLGTTVPYYSLGIPPLSAANIPATMPGIDHPTAISIAITTTRAGSTNPSGTVDYNIFIKQ